MKGEGGKTMKRKTQFGMPTLVENRTLEDNAALCRRLGLDFIELKATKEGYPLYKKLGFEEQHSTYTPMKFNLSNQT
jgi:hypothetical protein